MSKFIFITIFLAALTVSVLPGVTSAYSETTVGGSLVATVIPKEPGPDTEVTVNLAGYGFSLDESQISWSLNGRPVEEGIGRKSYTFKTGALGETTTVTIATRTKTGRVIAKRLVFQPADVEIIWEADTYVPYFYEGAALPTAGSPIKVIALPQFPDSTGDLIPAKDLVFTWRRDYRNLVRESGVGKDFTSFAAGLSPQKHIVEVTVTSPRSDMRAYKKIEIPVAVPEVVIYPYLPLEGIHSGEAITRNFQIKKENTAFKAEPYFFSSGSFTRSALTYDWQVNGKSASGGANDRSILQTVADTKNSGAVEISISVQDLLNRFAAAKTSASVLLEKSLFGL